MVPICYENGLPGGCSTECATFLNIATETYIKEALSKFFSHVNSNGDKYVKTAAFKRQVEKEEERVARGEIVKTAGGLLPVEVEELRKRKPLDMEEIRLALELGDSYLGQVPLIAESIAGARKRYLDDDEADGVGQDEGPTRSVAAVVNGLAANKANPTQPNGVTNGFLPDAGDPMIVDEEWGWRGGQVTDVDALDAVLDGCLAVGV
jgi:transcriptional coactivator HFI1/ADA1